MMETLKRYGKIALTLGMLFLILFIPVTDIWAQFTRPAACSGFDVKTHVVTRFIDGQSRRTTEPYVICTAHRIVPASTDGKSNEK